MVRWKMILGLGCLLIFSGCDLGWDSDEEEVKTEIIESEEGQGADAAPQGESASEDTLEEGESDAAESTDETSGGSGLPVSLSQVVWLHTDVSDWAQTANLSDVYIQGDLIFLEYDKSRSWPAVNVGDARVNANAWIFVNQGGTWYAGTWEWLKPGQTAKSVRAVRGDHIKASPLNNFVPRSGTQYGFMVSGLARISDHFNVEERSNVVMMTWP